MSLKESAYQEEFISFEEQLKQIRKDLEETKGRCDSCIKSANEKKLKICGCYGEKVLMILDETKQKLREVKKLLDLN